MKHYPKQLEAIGSALLLIERLPAQAIWALECTNDDDAEHPTVLNIFADEDDWASLAMTLRIGKAIDRNHDEKFLSFRQGTLLISFIEETK